MFRTTPCVDPTGLYLGRMKINCGETGNTNRNGFEREVASQNAFLQTWRTTMNTCLCCVGYTEHAPPMTTQTEWRVRIM